MKAKSGQSILIHAGAGGVGSLLIQLAKMQGLTVITTASQRNHAWLYSLGADQVIRVTLLKFAHRLIMFLILLDKKHYCARLK
ncbi:hypothetical protein ABE953_04515 [Ligilactobacillus salivarius]|uniref:hypothetical protein n=1 Tax=Ligilactobacillus salivarius TaxID=1624 RepID=UPI003977493D